MLNTNYVQLQALLCELASLQARKDSRFNNMGFTFVGGKLRRHYWQNADPRYTGSLFDQYVACRNNAVSIGNSDLLRIIARVNARLLHYSEPSEIFGI